MVTRVKLLDSNAEIPKKAHETDTGYDIKFIGVDKIIGDVIFFKTGLAIQPPVGHYFEMVPRSSISKLPLEMANSIGVIDEHYRGEIVVPVRITHPDMGQDKKNVVQPNGVVRMFGARPNTMSGIANLVLSRKPVLFQMILRKRLDTVFEEAEELIETERGDGGFGSTDEIKATITNSTIRKKINSAFEEIE